MPRLTPCLWFDTEGEEAAKFSTSVFPDSRMGGVSYPDAASTASA